MSIEFFQIMELIEIKARAIKFLENSHSELFSKYHKDAVVVLSALEKMEKGITADLKKKSATVRPKKKK